MLIGVQLISELVHTTLLTGRLKTDTPVSLMLIAAPESGKTSIVIEKGAEDTAFSSDATGSGITQELQTHPKATHIVINDMVSVMAHKEHVNKRTMSIISAMTDEGLHKIMMPGGGAADFKGRKVGIICCIPTELASDERRWWNACGLSTRMVPFAYDYSKHLVFEIKMQVVMSGAYERRNGIAPIVIPDKFFDIQIDAKFAKRIQRIADLAARELEERGIRRGKQFRALARGHAIYRNNNHPQMGDEDLDFLERILPYISYTPQKDITI